MLTAIVIILFALVLVLDLLPGFGKRPLRERIVYLTAFSASFVFLLLSSLGVNIPGLSGALISLFKEILPNI